MFNVIGFISANPTVPEMLKFSAIGFCIVMLVLAIQAFATQIVGMCFVSFDKLKARRAAELAAKQPAVKATAFAGVPDEHAFVIAAAVAAVMPELKEEDNRLRAVIAAAAATAAETSPQYGKPDMAYAREGRLEDFASKNYTAKR